MAASFTRASAMLDEIWLRDVLRRINREYGNVHARTVQNALHATFDLCTRQLHIPYGHKGFVRKPREFAAHVVILELKRHAIH